MVTNTTPPSARRRRLARAASVLLAGAVAAAVLAVSPAPGGAAPGAEADYVALFRPGHDARQEAPAVSRQHGLQLGRVYGTISGFSFRGTATKADALSRNPNIAVVDRDQQVAAQEVGPTEAPAGVRRVGAPVDATVGAGTTVAVLDTGIDLDHPDLASQITGGKDCVEADGRVSYDDNQYHGTHVAGTIAAAADGKGVVGVAPGAKLHAVKVLGADGRGAWSDILCGIDYVTANAASITVANMSLGGSGTAGAGCSSSSLRLAICQAVAAGVPFVVAAGNSGADAGGFVPAAYPEVIAVSAIDLANDSFASFSNFGSVVDATAPGVAVYSTVPAEQGTGGYGNLNGTSMASPHVAAVAALAIRKDPTLRPSSTNAGAPLRSVLRSTGTCVGRALVTVGESCTSPWGNSRDADNEPMVDAARATSTTVTAAPAPAPAAGAVAVKMTSTVVNSKFWSATATVTATDSNGALVSGVTVVGDWTGRYSATGRSCVTGTNGSCQLGTPSLDRKTVASATFTVTQASKTGHTFSVGASGTAYKV